MARQARITGAASHRVSPVAVIGPSIGGATSGVSSFLYCLYARVHSAPQRPGADFISTHCANACTRARMQVYTHGTGCMVPKVRSPAHVRRPNPETARAI